jgi:hypothetical protein
MGTRRSAACVADLAQHYGVARNTVMKRCGGWLMTA